MCDVDIENICHEVDFVLSTLHWIVLSDVMVDLKL